MPNAIRHLAPAKINLTLHVTGQRSDGYHELDSLVVFASHGDWISVMPSAELGLSVTGPQSAGVPSDERNLVWHMAQACGTLAHITLEKHLPSASGIGGGSSDAAATFIALRDMGLVKTAPDLVALGADIPVCVRQKATRLQGIGDILHDCAVLPQLPALLLNPGQGLPTPAIFTGLRQKTNDPMPKALPQFKALQDMVFWLRQMRNDLEPAAIAALPVIQTCLAWLANQPGCLLARMSGSGATCFGLFATEDAARAASKAQMPPTWWRQQVTLNPLHN